MEYLVSLFDSGLRVNSISVVRSALSSALPFFGGFSLGNHPLMIKLFNGFYQERPRVHKAAPCWSVDNVLNSILAWGENSSLALSKLTWKLAMLMSLSVASRCSELAYLDLSHAFPNPSGIEFLLTRHKKNRKHSALPGKLFVPKIELAGICPVQCLNHYIERTKDARSANASSNLVFRSLSNPESGVTPKTISRWLTSCIQESGFTSDNSTIGHSVRSKAVTKASLKGMSTQDIINAVGWKNDSCFHKFYFKPEQTTNLGSKVLTLG